MQTSKPIPENGQSRNGEKPESELEVYDRAVSPSATDSFLSKINLGIGNYKNKEYWQNVESFQRNMYSEAAFGRLILERAIQRTQRHMALEKWEELDEEERPEEPELGEPDRLRFVERKGPELWNNLGPDPSKHMGEERKTAEEELVEAQIAALEEYTGVTSSWTSPFGRMLQARHEMSRSRGGRLMDNLFGRKKTFRYEGDENAKKRLGKVGGRH